MADWVQRALAVPGVQQVEVNLFDPPWTPARITAR
jgi:metal-sulfur cluster biosynthetic enzyme